MRTTWRVIGVALLGVAVAAGAGIAASQAQAQGGAPAAKKKSGKAHRPKIEKLACRLGTEDQHEIGRASCRERV